ncbi:AraC family transcriptional regulator [Demequina sp. NBRC 110057]|uniref:helix-turn-helix domain-containing protein n=1 Tax=Demequina sp. NBRC 110057 TaxID=1570346 RepID=UPI0011782796|nr:AraC family transcriptional regulator [Demequina sp. NBRC 110057]
MTIPDGFARERLCVVPRPEVTQALARPVTRRLVVTDAGMFPEARGHGRTREHGAREAIVMVCARGAGWVEVAGRRYAVSTGDAVVLPPGRPHRYGASPSAPWTLWWCHLRGADVDELLEATGAGADRPVIGLNRPERVIGLLDEVVTALEGGATPAGLLTASGAAWRMLAQVAADRVTPGSGSPLERAIGHLEDNVARTVSVGEVAALVGVSPSHLGALFRGATGGGVLAYQSSLRMGRARGLLDGTEMSVGEIAAAVGYEDPLYFSRRFSRAHGLSPSAYRALGKG